MDVLAEIRTDPELLALVPNVQSIAQKLSQRLTVQSRFIGVGTVLDVLGPVEGAQVLDALETLKSTSSPVKWAFILLERGELDIGLDSVRTQIDALTGSVFTESQATVLKNLALVPVSVSDWDVAKAIFNDDGTLRV